MQNEECKQNQQIFCIFNKGFSLRSLRPLLLIITFFLRVLVAERSLRKGMKNGKTIHLQIHLTC